MHATGLNEIENLEDALSFLKENPKEDLYWSIESVLASCITDNYYGELPNFSVKDIEFEIESIWDDEKERLWIHVQSSEFEGDIRFNTLSNTLQTKIIFDLLGLYKREEEEWKQEHPGEEL